MYFNTWAGVATDPKLSARSKPEPEPEHIVLDPQHCFNIRVILSSIIGKHPPVSSSLPVIPKLQSTVPYCTPK